MQEVVYDYEEFKSKVDTTQAIHHDGIRESIDKEGIIYRIVFRMYGIDKNNGHIIVFEAFKRTSIMELEKHPQDYKDFVDRFAKPLGSTEGRWKKK